MSRPAKATVCPLCHVTLSHEQPVYHTVTKELYKVREWTAAGPIETGETGERYPHWYACEACAREKHPQFFRTVESLKPLEDKLAANPDDLDARYEYLNAKECCYLEHRRCAWCNRPIWEKNGFLFARWKRMGPLCCSSNCTNARANASRAERVKLYRTPKEATCLTCEKKFAPTRSDARFCSNACRQKHHRLAGRTTLSILPHRSG